MSSLVRSCISEATSSEAMFWTHHVLMLAVKAVLSEEHSLLQWLNFIIFWQLKSWRINLILRIVTLVLLYELITRFGQIFTLKFVRTQRLPDMVQDRTITSWHNLLQRIQIQGAPPLTINRSGSEVLCTQQLNNLKELLLCKNHFVHKTTWIQLELIWKSKTQASASDSYSCWTLDFFY
jgi:hypothetical protein